MVLVDFVEEMMMVGRKVGMLVGPVVGMVIQLALVVFGWVLVVGRS